MKTALRELIDWMENTTIPTGQRAEAYHNKAIELLEKERGDIINTYWEGYKEGQYGGDRTAEEYYNQNKDIE